MIDYINLLLLLLLLLYLNRFFVRFCKNKLYARPCSVHAWQPHSLVRAYEEAEREKARKWRHRLYVVLSLFY